MMLTKVVTLALGALLFQIRPPMPAQPVSSCEQVQWVVLGEVPACCTPDNPYGPTYAGVRLISPEDTTNGQVFPFAVPSNRWLGIGTVEVSSKLFYFAPDSAHGSYFHLSHDFTLEGIRDTLLLSVPTMAPYIRFTPPLRVEPGKIVYADFMNGAPQAQFMSATITGYLSSDPEFKSCAVLSVGETSIKPVESGLVR